MEEEKSNYQLEAELAEINNDSVVNETANRMRYAEIRINTDTRPNHTCPELSETMDEDGRRKYESGYCLACILNHEQGYQEHIDKWVYFQEMQAARFLFEQYILTECGFMWYTDDVAVTYWQESVKFFIETLIPDPEKRAGKPYEIQSLGKINSPVESLAYITSHKTLPAIHIQGNTASFEWFIRASNGDICLLLGEPKEIARFRWVHNYIRLEKRYSLDPNIEFPYLSKRFPVIYEDNFDPHFNLHNNKMQIWTWKLSSRPAWKLIRKHLHNPLKFLDLSLIKYRVNKERSIKVEEVIPSYFNNTKTFHRDQF